MKNNEPRFDLHAIRYGEVFSADMEATGYSEENCAECAYGHRCCEQIVSGTPAEAAGILQWLSKNSPDVMETGRAVTFRASILRDHFKKFVGKVGDPTGAAISHWYAKRLKCVFYDGEEKTCSIYPVRPLACRRVFGAENGMGVVAETKEGLTARVARFKVHQDLNSNISEITALVAMMATSQAEMYVDNDFFTTDPATLTDDQVIFGLAGAPTPNPVKLDMEDNHGNARRPDDNAPTRA